MKTLVLGSGGQLGLALAETAPSTVGFVGAGISPLDITERAELLNVCRELRPAVIINAAAYTAVDKAESDIGAATAVNVDGAANAAAAALEIGARLIHISTDYVFDGKASRPYPVGAETNPINVYGRTKRAGELAVLEAMPGRAVVVRTAWLYSRNGANFVKTMLRLMAERDSLSVVADQRGTPTWADSLASAIWAFVAAPKLAGNFHWTDGGDCTWHDFAVAIQAEALSLGLLQREIPILAVTTDKYPTAAPRPGYTVMDCSGTWAVLDRRPNPWRENLRRMLEGMVS